MAISFFRVKSQFENLGDALINRELIALLRSRGDVHLEVSSAPAKFLNLLNIATTEVAQNKLRFYFKLIVSALTDKTPTYLFLNPGGHGGEVSVKDGLKKKINYYCLLLLKLAGVRICHVGISYSELGSRHAGLLRPMSRLLHCHAVRDTKSQALAEREGIVVNQVLPDLAFNLEVDTSSRNRDVDCFFSFRETSTAESNHALSKLVQASIAAGSKVRIGFQVEFDANFNRQLAGEINQDAIAMTSSLSENVEFFRNCKYVVSNRLHVLLLALSAGAIPVAVTRGSENEKIVGVFDGANIAHHVFDISSFEIHMINGLEVSQTLVDTCQKKRQELQSFFKLLD